MVLMELREGAPERTPVPITPEQKGCFGEESSSLAATNMG
jgi:hypothetical protein